MAGTRAPVAVGGFGAVLRGALPAGRRMAVLRARATATTFAAHGVNARCTVQIVAPRLSVAIASGTITAIVRVRLGDLDMRFRQFFEEAGRDRRLPQAVDTAVRGEPEVQVLLGARQPDIGEAALFL